VLQGRYVEHMGIPASGSGERIVSVTSFRPKDPILPDSSVLDQIRKHSIHTEIYKQYTIYRLKVLEARTQAKIRELEEKYAENTRDGSSWRCFKETVNPKDLDTWVREQGDYLRITVEQVSKIDPHPIRRENCWEVEGKGDAFNQI